MSGEKLECDVLVIGSGAGGMAAAVTAARNGLKVIVAEKADVYGGTSAWAGGFLWMPGNPVSARDGHRDEPGSGETYLKALLGNHYDPDKIGAYLTRGPEMVSFFEANDILKFISAPGIPDFYSATPGGSAGGRIIGAAPTDGRSVGKWWKALRQPPAEYTLGGMYIASGADRWHFINALRSPGSFIYVVRRILRHWGQMLRHGRPTEIYNGGAMMAQLGRAGGRLGVELKLSTRAEKLLREDGKVVGAVLQGPEGEQSVHASKGVVLATGGFSQSPDLRSEIFPPVAAQSTHLSAMPPDLPTGDGLKMATEAGAAVDRSGKAAGGWAPVSQLVRRDGSVAHFAHLVERGKPGIIGVLASGKRFADEASSYQDFIEALLAQFKPGEEAGAWLVCGQKFLRRYGLGAVKPFPLPIGQYLQSGYLKRGDTLEALARACGIDPAGLADTVHKFDAAAARGEDPEFGRGSTAFEKAQGDPSHGPNPCVAPIGAGPYYAVKIQPGTMGTLAGLATDHETRVLDETGKPIPGLHAAGNDMSSVFGGHYPSGGVVLGPALTFGYVAGKLLSGK